MLAKSVCIESIEVEAIIYNIIIENFFRQPNQCLNIYNKFPIKFHIDLTNIRGNNFTILYNSGSETYSIWKTADLFLEATTSREKASDL